MKRFTFALSTLTLFSAVFGIVASPDTAVAASKEQVSLETAPVPAMTGGLCGMTQADIQGIVDDYDLAPEAGWVQDALQQPFDCGAYGELCELVGPQDAHNYVCNVWSAFDQGMAISTISQEAREYIDEHGIRCTPDASECEETCDELGKPVRRCIGTTSVLDGSCITISYCASLWEVIGFRPFLIPFL